MARMINGSLSRRSGHAAANVDRVPHRRSGTDLTRFGTGPSTSTTSGTSSAAETPVKLKTVAAAEWKKVIEEHKGKVVVVDVWATWWSPCRKKYPDFLALAKKYPKEDLVCISLTVDEKDEHEAALKFLKDQSSGVPNYRYEDKKDYQDEFNIKGLPVAYVYGRDGKLAKKFDVNEKDFTYADVEAEVEVQTAKK